MRYEIEVKKKEEVIVVFAFHIQHSMDGMGRRVFAE